MRLSFSTRFVVVGLVLFAAAGCTHSASTANQIKTPQELTLYSIKTQPNFADQGHGRFHDYPILGQVEIADAAKRAEIMTAIAAGFTTGEVPTCFWPRHAIHTVVDGKTIDYIICFECSQIEISGEQSRTEVINSSAKPVLNKFLEAAGVPLEPDARE